MWTRSQRKALLALCAALLMFLLIELHRKPIELPDPAPERSPRADELLSRIDPNTADAAALAAIPNIGEKKAAQIVAYRESFVREHPNSIAFRSAEDLRQVKGFGPATVANMKPYLEFDIDSANASTFAPAATTK